ncbi:MAG: hypothetical protein IID61_17795 [SAR324 cluster bacterium]|nr:hypothetical protein [SAR324 cluster bacterium]
MKGKYIVGFVVSIILAALILSACPGRRMSNGGSDMGDSSSSGRDY